MQTSNKTSAEAEKQSAKSPRQIQSENSAPVSETPQHNQTVSRSLIQRVKHLPRSIHHNEVRQLQRTIGNQAVSHLASKPRTAPAHESIKGLPDTLKTGMENLSGLSMDSVSVHYNSPEPDRINALAFASGNEIHLAPKQEQHLPHEAWHVVQQFTGRVSQTTTDNGVAISDDQQLETEASEMGQKALSMPDSVFSDSGSDGTPNPPQTPNHAIAQYVVQREKKKFQTLPNDNPTVVQYRDDIEHIIDDIDAHVDQARALAMQWRNYLNSDKPHLANWAAAAKAYYDNPRIVPEFIHARFGYAVETLACDNLNTNRGKLHIDYQVTVGSTRPDIVILDKNTKEQISWVDITSKDSQNHILGKSSSGWKTRPFVYEILYDPLKLNEILTGSSDPIFLALGNYLSDKHEIQTKEHAKKLQELTDALNKLRSDNNWETGYGNVKDKQEDTKKMLTSAPLNMDLGLNVNLSAKGALALANLNPGPFGYAKGKTDSYAAKYWLDTTAAPKIKKKQDKLEVGLYNGVVYDTYNEQSIPFVFDYYHGYLETQHDSRDRVMTGLAVRIALDRYDQLDNIEPRIDLEETTPLEDGARTLLDAVPTKANGEQLQKWVNTVDVFLMAKGRFDQLEILEGAPLAGLDVRINQIQTAISQHLKDMPNVLNVPAMRNWIQNADQIITTRNLIPQTIQTQQDFIQYLRRKYKTSFDVFLRSPLENNLLMQLNSMPKNNQSITSAQQYMALNPVP